MARYTVADNDFLKLENALLRAGREMEFPATPAIAARVRAELASSSRAARNVASDRAPAPGGWRVLVPLAAAVLLALALLVASPTTREAMGQFLGLRGLRIFYVTPTPTPTAIPTMTVRPTVAAVRAANTAASGLSVTPTRTPQATRTPTGQPNTICCETTLTEAQRKAHFELLVLPNEAPSKVYYQPFADVGAQIVMVFGNPAKPRYTLYQAQQWVYGKLLGKMLGGDTILSETQVNGRRALWFSGAPHVVLMLDAQGNPNFETQRTVNANTLAWESGSGDEDVLYRLETTGTLEQAVKFAESLVAAP